MVIKNDRSEESDKGDRIVGLTFHRTFSLVRPALTTIMQLAFDQEGKELNRKFIREHTNLGTVYIQAMPRYCYGSGLLDRKNRLTPFGEMAHHNDPLLEQSGTQWLMHYYLSAPLGPGAAFWHNLVVSCFRIGNEFTHKEITHQIFDFVTSIKSASPRIEDAETTATIFLGSYTKSDGLNNLGIVSEIGSRHYHVLDPEAPPTWAVACALLNFWQAQFPGQATINLNDLYGERGLTSLFMISKGRLNTMLEEMQQEGMIELYRVAPPYQVVPIWQDMQQPLEKLYGTKTA